MEAFLPSSRRSVSMVPHEVASKIQHQILAGQLKPGDRLPAQRALSEQFKVSRASVREALSVLETLGLIDIRPGLGMFVSPHVSEPRRERLMDAGSARDVYEARLGLEPLAASLAAERIDEKALALLRDHVTAMELAYGRQDLVAMAVADAAFHDAVVLASGNPLIAAFYVSARESMERTQRAPMAHRVTLAETVREHRAVLEAIEQREPQQAGHAMRAHIRGSARRLGLTLAIGS